MIKINQEKNQISSDQIHRDTYFFGEINGTSGLFCKVYGDKIICIDHKEFTPVSIPVSVSDYKPVQSLAIVVAEERPREIRVRDIPAGTTFTGRQGTHTGIFLKRCDGGLLYLESHVSRQHLSAWDTYCADNIVYDYKVVDLDITCEI